MDKIANSYEKKIQEFSLYNLNQELSKENNSSKMAKMPAPPNEDKYSSSTIALQDPAFRITESIYTLPENWPKIAQMKDHIRISELSNCKTPSVKRAVSHIELMQSVIDDWFFRVSEEMKSRTDNLHGCTPGSKKHLKFLTVVRENSMVAHDYHSHRTVPASRALSSGCNDLSLIFQSGHVHKDDDMQDIPYLGAEEVIGEVITLLAELENDRMETQEKFTKEIKRAKLLRRKIDELQLHHLQELPALVQREHEACLMNLIELQWHVTYTKRLQVRVQSKFSVSSKRNAQLKEDIGFVKHHVPLVQEKLVLEIETMDVIRKAQGDTDQKLVVAQQRLAKTEMKSQEAVSKTNTEKMHMAKELTAARDDLNSISDQLSEAKQTYEAYVQQMNDIDRKLAENEQEMEVLRVKNGNAKILEEVQATKVRDFQSKVTEAEFDHNKLVNDNLRQEHVLKMNKDNHIHTLTGLEQKRIALDKQLWKLSRKNQESEMEVQDCQEKITKCDQQKAADVKNMARMKQEMERATAMLQNTLDQHQLIFNNNNHMQDQLKAEQYQTFSAEEKLKKIAESLRKQVQDEIHAKTVLQARIRSDLSENEKSKLDSEIKKDKAKAVTDELEQAVSVVLKKVKKLQATKTEMQNTKEDLRAKINETEKQYKESNERFSLTMAEVKPNHQTVKNELFALTSQLETMEERSITIKKKAEEMDAAQIMMEKVARTLQQNIQTLTAEMNELNLRMEAGKKIVADLLKQFNDTLERLKGSEGKHKSLQKDRHQVLTQHETDKAQEAEKNKELASRYRQLQREYIKQKERMLTSYDERVKTEASITDMKQLKAFQSKLHAALVEYFKLRGLYSQSELSKLEQVSSDNSVRVSELQVNMQRALDHIARFLSSQSEEQLAPHYVWDSARKGKDSQNIPALGVSVKPVAPPMLV